MNNLKYSKNKNGLDIYTETIEHAKTVTFSIYVRVGSYNEDKHKGIAHFLEHMVFKGTKTRDSRDLMEEIEVVGGYINAETSFEHTRYHATVPKEHWKIAADIISDISFKSTIPEEEIDLERTVIQEELKMYKDDSSSYAQDLLFEKMHKSYPNRQSIGGTVESVSKIDRESLIQFKNKYYQPSNMFVVASGKINHDEVVKFMEDNYNIGNNLAISYDKEEFEPDVLNSDTESVERNIEQAHLCWGLFAPSSKDKDKFPIDVVSTILGGSTCSRLYQLIREKKGLAYTIETNYCELSDNGMIIGYVGLEDKNLDSVKEIIVEEFERLRKELVDDAELKRAISYIKGNHTISLEKPSAINGYIGSSLINNDSVDPEDYIRGIESVTKEDIQRVCMKYFTPDNWQFTQITPKTT